MKSNLNLLGVVSDKVRVKDFNVIMEELAQAKQSSAHGTNKEKGLDIVCSKQDSSYGGKRISMELEDASDVYTGSNYMATLKNFNMCGCEAYLANDS